MPSTRLGQKLRQPGLNVLHITRDFNVAVGTTFTHPEAPPPTVTNTATATGPAANGVIVTIDGVGVPVRPGGPHDS